jgi:hypothetical protein
MTGTRQEIGLAQNPLNLCPHGLYDGSGDCDECRAEHEALESEYQEKLDREEREHYAMLDARDDPYADEPFFEVAL